MRREFYGLVVVLIALEVLAYLFWPLGLWSLLVVGPLVAIGMYDALQNDQAVRRNFPLIGNFRYMFEAIRPEIQQYFVESDLDGKPINREARSVIYQRAKRQLQTLPFGTRLDVYAPGYEWFNHSLAPKHVETSDLRVMVGGPDCKQPYSASLMNISAMSFGSLSKTAVEALNLGAKLGGFAHNTGEGGLSSYHLSHQGDVIWQVGTGYFGAREKDGTFSEKRYADTASAPSVKMIELKLSQGAKPGHGGILPAAKITPEIAAIRGVEMGHDIISPPAHSSFSTPIELCLFLQRLREQSGGKPIGFKLCLGRRREFLAICKAMIETDITPDFITVDGGEGGTGAAPVEFSNHLGTPLADALIFVNNALTGFDLRTRIRLFAAGRILDGKGLLKACALGADVGYSARGFMLALGCIQALRCNSNHCPVGVATQNPQLVLGLDPADKGPRAFNYHHQTVEASAELLGAMGLAHTRELRPWHLVRRMDDTKVKHYGELYEFVAKGSFLDDDVPATFRRALGSASSSSFGHAGTLAMAAE